MTKNSYSALPEWVTAKVLREQIYPIGLKELYRLCRERKIPHKVEEWGKKKRYLFPRDKVRKFFAEGYVEPEAQIEYVTQLTPIKEVNKFQGGATMAKWSKEDSHGRCRLDCGDGQIIERPGKRGNSYDMQFRDETGKRRTKVLKRVKNKADALVEYRKLRNEMIERQSVHGNPDITFSEFVPVYLRELRGRKLRCYRIIENAIRNRLEPFFCSFGLKEIRPRDVEYYRNERQDDGASDATIKQELSFLRNMVNVAIEKEYEVGANPVRIGKLGLHVTERTRWMRDEEQERLWPVLEKYPKPLKDLAEFVLNTGMRPNNVINLRWKQILWKESQIFVSAEESKNKHDMYFGLNETALAILERLKKANGHSEYVFARYGENRKPRKVTHRWYQRCWKKACEEAGVEDLRFYEMKHTLGTRLAAQGESAFTIKSVMNHRNLSSTERYVKNHNGANIEALKRMEQNHNGNGVISGVK